MVNVAGGQQAGQLANKHSAFARQARRAPDDRVRQVRLKRKWSGSLTNLKLPGRFRRRMPPVPHRLGHCLGAIKQAKDRTMRGL